MKILYKTNSSKRYLRFMTIYAIIMLIIVVCVAIASVNNKFTESPSVEDSESITEILTEYVYIRQDTYATEATVQTEPELYIVKEYLGQIGIFYFDGTLIDVLDVYIKTLPEADRRMLGEGISVDSKAKLNSIIEDYSG